MDVAKGTRTHVQEEDRLPGSDPAVGFQKFLRALDVVIPRLIRPAGVHVPPAGSWFIADLRGIKADRVFAR